jgi:hypothetical protein
MTDLSLKTPNFHAAPIGVLLVTELHSLIAIVVNTQSGIIIFGKLEPKRLDSLNV